MLAPTFQSSHENVADESHCTMANLRLVRCKSCIKSATIDRQELIHSIAEKPVML